MQFKYIMEHHHLALYLAKSTLEIDKYTCTRIAALWLEESLHIMQL